MIYNIRTISNNSNSKLVLCALLLYGIIFMSPIWRWLIPIQNSIYLLIILALVGFYHVFYRCKVSKLEIVLMSALMAFAMVSGIYWVEPRVGLYPIFFLTAWWILSISTYQDIEAFVSVSSMIMIVVIMGAWIGFLYALQGGEEMGTFVNPDGRPNLLYLSTLSNARIYNYIRPSGVYDEPGTLSFLICAIAATRHLLDYDKRVTWILIVFGLVTTSLAHIVYMFFHILAERITVRKLAIIGIVGILVIAGAAQTEAGSAFERLLIVRLQVEDGQLAGDNRSELMMTAAGHLSPLSAIVGLDASATVDARKFQRTYPQVGSVHPLAPLVRQGILLAAGYYVFLIVLLVKGLSKRRLLVLVGVAALFMQRPYIMSMGYAIWALLPLMIVYGRFRVKSRIHKLSN